MPSPPPMLAPPEGAVVSIDPPSGLAPSAESLSLIIDTSYVTDAEAIDAIVESAALAASVDPRQGIATSFVDLNTYVGSSDSFRNAVGGYFYNERDSYGNLMVPPLFYKFIPQSNPNPNIYSVRSVSSNLVNENAGPLATIGGDDKQDVAARGFGAESALHQELLLPYVEFICEVEGDPDSEYLSSPMSGNKYWQKLFTGGKFLYDDVKSIWGAAVFDDHYMLTVFPYQNIQKQYMVDPDAITNYIAATYQYNHYLPNYQQFASAQKSELTLPNWYVTNLVAQLESYRESTLAIDESGNINGIPNLSDELDPTLLNPNIIDYYTCGKTRPLEQTSADLQWPPASDYFQDSPDAPTPEPPSYLTPTWEVPYATYLEDKFPAMYRNISGSSLDYIKSRYRNIFFSNNATSRFLKKDASLGDESPNYAGMVPFYNHIQFPTMPSGPYSLLMAEHEYSTFFLRTLKETFLGQNADRLPVGYVQFLRNELFLTPSATYSKDEKTSTSSVKEYRCVDLLKMLMYSYDTIYNDYEDFFVMDYNSIDTMAAEDAAGVYRAYNTKNVTKVINGILKSLAPATSRYNINSIFKILNSQNPISPMSVADEESLAAVEPAPKMNEVIAYRVEKIGGPVSGDSNTESVLQNFWIYNNTDLSDLDFIDTQVKYDKNYTYNIYAYYIVGGFKYEYSDLRISRIIGQVNEDGYSGPLEMGSGISPTAPPPPIAYCIEYYDPFTNKRTSDFLENAAYGDTSEIEISGFATDAQRIAVSAKYQSTIEGDDEISRVMPPYKAQFLVTAQPSIKLVEVPLLHKTYKILDQPPNKLDVVPAHVLGNSNQLTFDIFYQTKSPEPFPRTILDSDETVKSEFLNANDFIGATDVVRPSISPQAFVEVYKLPSKPESFKDFSGNLLTTVPLGMEGTNYSYTTATFNDIVKSNHKYYYLFRAVNSNNITGTADTIIEAQIVNDGGYKYATFEVLFEEDLKKENHKQTSSQFKNLFQLTPNLSQTTLVEKEANFDETALSNYEKVQVGSADDLIWDKTFKIRLTSKKTGKKIDLNITYSDPDVINEDD